MVGLLSNPLHIGSETIGSVSFEGGEERVGTASAQAV